MKQRFLYFAVLPLLLGSCARPLTNFTVPEEQPVAQPVNFTNQTEQAQTYLWDFGDGNTSTDVSPEHRYFNSGTYTVKLTATNEKGKSATKEKKIT
ncbi:MAG: PKD domain-containing protein, partial [Bacteroidota bacterium]